MPNAHFTLTEIRLHLRILDPRVRLPSALIRRLSISGPAACPGGDGALFTRDAREPEEFTAEELSSTRTTISNLYMTAAGTINLSGSPLFVKTFEGVGNVVDGDLAIKEKWSLSYGSVNSGGKLNIEGKLIFSEGAVIEFDHENVRPQAPLKPMSSASKRNLEAVNGGY